mmetsp:Transcript_10578/g.39402  ORF Transcript_10578/g.39402 Transcript_10578/m.39402 type:complete len:81 (+) Transcript_10578:22-264(+)
MSLYKMILRGVIAFCVNQNCLNQHFPATCAHLSLKWSNPQNCPSFVSGSTPTMYACPEEQKSTVSNTKAWTSIRLSGAHS